MILPKELKEQFQTELTNYEEENKMPYITSIEEIGMEKATRQSVIEVLETRFENVPETIVNTINNIKDIQDLKQLLKRSILIDSLENFESLLNEKLANN